MIFSKEFFFKKIERKKKGGGRGDMSHALARIFSDSAHRMTDAPTPRRPGPGGGERKIIAMTETCHDIFVWECWGIMQPLSKRGRYFLYGRDKGEENLDV